MARKKKQTAQEVQEVINGHKLDPQTAIKLEPALRLMRKAAAYFGTPIEKTSLADASKMLKEPAEKIASLNIDGITGEVIATAEKALGKKAKDITTADIENSFISIELPGTENIDINTPDGAKILAEKLSAAFKEISESPEYKTSTAITHQTKIILSLFSEHGQQVSDAIEKAAEFNDILPFIMLELAERSGDVLTIETAREILKSGEKGDKDKTPFEKKIDHVLDQFTFAGEPTTDFAKELLEAANKRKTDFYDSQEFIEVIEAITSVAESVNSATDTEKAEIVKRELPTLKQALPVYLKVAKGLPTDVLLYADKKTASIDDITKVGTLKTHDVSMFVKEYESTISNLGINTDKLLNYAIYHFTKNNDFRNKKEINCSVIFDLRDYAYMLGYDVFPHNNTDKEKKRANKRLDKVRKNVNKNLDLLFALSISWKDDSKRTKDRHDYNRINLMSERGQIKNNMVNFTFTPNYAAYLVNRNVIGQYPAKLLAMDSRKTTAYKIAKKLFDYYFIDNNIINGTNDILSIKSILPFSGLASYEEVQKKDRGHWIERIKEPLEAALDELTQLQILSDWEYTHEKKKALSYDEAAAIIDYYEYEKLYLHFTPYEELDQQERIEAKQQRIAAATERKAKRKQAAINQNIKKKANKEINAQGKT